MIDPKNRTLVFIQIVIWALFYLISAYLYKLHYGIHLDSPFTIRFSLITLFFISVNIWLIIRLLRPQVEKIEDELYSTVKEFNTNKEKLEIENRLYRILFDSIDDPVFVINESKNVFFMNNSFIKKFSIKNDSQFIPLIEISRNLEFQNLITTCFSENKSKQLTQFTFDDDLTPIKNFFDIKIAPIKFTSHYLGVFHDVTDRKLSDQIREDFISNFSHEIRTPLTILNAQIQSIRAIANEELSSTKKLDSTFLKIENNSRRLTSLFDDLLSLTSIEKQKKLNLEHFDLEPMLDFLSQDIALKFPNIKITFEFQLNMKSISADYNLLEQAIINLIDNAVKYSSENPVIKIMTEKDSKFQIISISDNGIGIPEDQQHRIFERFFRIDISRSQEITGTGLGLAIVKHIIQKHDGKIKVNSKLNVGTTVTILLPV